MGKELKVGVKKGSGPEPGYQWSVWMLKQAIDEARKLLTDDQYVHIAMQVKELAKEQDPAHSEYLSVDAIEDFHELREKGGPLGKLNVRVFFYLDKRPRPHGRHHPLVVLGTIKKEEDGATSPKDKKRIRQRLDKYLDGKYGSALD